MSSRAFARNDSTSPLGVRLGGETGWLGAVSGGATSVGGDVAGTSGSTGGAGSTGGSLGGTAAGTSVGAGSADGSLGGTAAGTSVGAGSTGGSDGGGTGEEFGGGVGAPDLDPPIDLRGTSCGSLLGGVDCAIAIDVTAMTVQRIERISER